MRILGIETSCDETSAAVLSGPCIVLSSVVSSQLEHLEYGGVVPELAARAHLRQLAPIVQIALDEAGLVLDDIEAVAATQGPGLIGALLVGFGFAHAMAWARGLPFAAVNHLEGHLLSPLLTDADFEPPFLGLIVSGGHTELIHSPGWHSYESLGSTLDDAVGEAFDKVAILLGLGYPGGPIIDRVAAAGRADAWAFPRARLGPGSLDFSFSGLKTAVRVAVERRRVDRSLAPGSPLPASDQADLAASFQAAAVGALVARLEQAVTTRPVSRVVVAGGVAANRALRAQARALCDRLGVRLHLPPLHYCGDNAAMIAAAGARRLEAGASWPLSVAPVADFGQLPL
ncbi:MAG: tRNA (adenosine(37)-N6)-threonylcarbamoyltransferase complex transferase subunit TsaD [Candidatus Eisenbacteria bacterium]|nr:tRNA (adenosine(37)-N6)-threonylcarbamoyltransferase complex transferase subunit TsaD [Candidatus Eisenbacteria bacterium]